VCTQQALETLSILLQRLSTVEKHRSLFATDDLKFHLERLNRTVALRGSTAAATSVATSVTRVGDSPAVSVEALVLSSPLLMANLKSICQHLSNKVAGSSSSAKASR
jgi:hypothetical protein